ncbi:cell division protein FtsQ/DivIB [Clostridium formicaceticum]|uniref:Cell division protein DivIB n=1 Tax=Clostridium formicaceticum TaxID=1497 RepID=A0AAC9RPK1_9CLOT|nr:FtsQ-type POTRA domain-containing protein [Clostridium formicaceticum]AOY77426.1 peptidase S33 [Clostridium formicaceticum]ARE87980.1 Cell division protein DivIB [Clostridium formicaceticum]
MEYLEKKREKQRIKNIRKRKIKKFLTAFFFIIVFFLWGIYFLLQSDLLNLKKIEVQGNIILTTEEIIDTGQLFLNRNIFQYKLIDIEKNLLSHPFIKEVSLQRKLPNRIIVTVREREKYAIIPYMGSYIYIDQDKVVLQVSENYLAEDLILITGVEFQSFNLGDQVDISKEPLLDAAIELIEASKLVTIGELISEINIGQEDYIKLVTFDGIEVLIGNKTDMAYSVLALKEVLTNLYTRNIKSVIVDMRYKGQISIRNRENWEEN